MSADGSSRGSLRLEQAEHNRLLTGLIVSMTLHLLCWGAWHTGNKYDLWKYIRLPEWLQSHRMLTELLKKPDPAQTQANQQQPPLMFVDVSAAQATTEVPPDAKYYSDKNALAANPDPTIDSNVPRIDGEQTQVVKTEDVPLPKPNVVPLQPALEPEPSPEPLHEVATPKLAEPPGDLAFAKPASEPTPQPKETPRRPRTIKEALAQLPDNSIVGRKMKQEGGVKRRSLRSSLDTVATPFGAYDAAVVAAVSSRWYQLLDERQFAADGAGKVTWKFRLHSDGSISQMKLEESTVDYALATICQRAIGDPAPYGSWPTEMRRIIGGETRSHLHLLLLLSLSATLHGNACLRTAHHHLDCRAHVCGGARTGASLAQSRATGGRVGS
jgi:hypothetical protein